MVQTGEGLSFETKMNNPKHYLIIEACFKDIDMEISSGELFAKITPHTPLTFAHLKKTVHYKKNSARSAQSVPGMLTSTL